MKTIKFTQKSTGEIFHRVALTRKEIAALVVAAVSMAAIWPELSVSEQRNAALLRAALDEGSHPQEDVLRNFLTNHRRRFGPILVKEHGGGNFKELSMRHATERGACWKQRKLKGNPEARRAARQEYAQSVAEHFRAAKVMLPTKIDMDAVIEAEVVRRVDLITAEVRKSVAILHADVRELRGQQNGYAAFLGETLQ